MSSSTNQNARTLGLVSIGLIVGAALAIVVFMALPKSTGQSDNSVADSPPVRGAASTVREGKSQKGKVASIARIAELDDLAVIDSAFERNFNLHGLLMHADERQLKQYLTHSSEVDSATLRDQIQTALVQRLAESNPKDALKAIAQLPGVRANHWSQLFLESGRPKTSTGHLPKPSL
ncbi:MAG: hypothetical protein F4X44_02875 [Gammaproteobacteria bacterium]|nr:hypothetical protein [Gammaproteobacteria bacterium]MYD79538.1 hypothetical protein [Gammaproteobacteria bacterium]